MIDYARHVRIFNMNPSDEVVEKRQEAVADLSVAFRKRADPTSQIKMAEDLVSGINSGRLPDELRGQVATAITKRSPSFIADEAELEVVSCALLASLHFLYALRSPGEEAKAQDLFVAAIASALEFQPPLDDFPRLEALVGEIRSVAMEMLTQRGEESRKRHLVGSVNFPSMSESTDSAELDGAVEPAIQALKINAELDREELNLLWWVLADWSDRLGAKFSALPSAEAGIAFGIESAALIRHLPGKGHLHLAQRFIGNDEKKSLGQMIEALGAAKEKLAPEEKHAEGVVKPHPHVFPLLDALCAQSVVGGRVGASRQFAQRQWARRAVLESILVKLWASLRT